MRIPLLLCAAALFSAPAKADKFWLSDPASHSASRGSPDVIEGVLIDQNRTSYHLRVVGGELVLPKSRVFKIEKDGLTVEKIVELEKKERERLAKLQERRALERAAARLKREVRAAEATASRRDREADVVVAPVRGVTPEVVPAGVGFDPVVGRAGYDYYTHMQLLAELELAWTLTKDRRYLKALRRLRRLH